MEADVQQRVLEGNKVLGAVRSILKGRTMSKGGKENLVPTGYSPHGHIRC